MKIIIAPDSFKGSLRAQEAATAIERGIRRVLPIAEITSIPLADGGEGTVEAMLAARVGQRTVCRVSGPLGAPVEAAYALFEDGTAVIEMASAAGLGLIPESQRDPRRTTTYGVGELIQAALEAGAARIVIGLGGSATNDGGAGALQALGVRFLDTQGAALPAPIGGSLLARAARIDVTGLRFPVGEIPVLIASDVTNPLLGSDGASAVYGPQKGADAAMVAELEKALARYAALIHEASGKDIATIPGGGAAGGMGAGLIAFLGATLQSGIDLVLDAADFEEKARQTDVVLTGEGRIDAQTLYGKAISGVLKRCTKIGVPVIAFGGAVDEAAQAILAEQGLWAAVPIVSGPVTLAEAMHMAPRLLEDAAARVMRLIAPQFSPKE